MILGLFQALLDMIFFVLPCILIVILVCDLMDKDTQSEKRKRILTYVTVFVFMIAWLQFWGFLYVKPFISGHGACMPIPTHILTNPQNFHIIVLLGIFCIGLMIKGNWGRIKKERGFLISIISVVFVMLCLLIFSLFCESISALERIIRSMFKTKLVMPIPIITVFICLCFLAVFSLSHYIKVHKVRWVITVVIIMFVCIYYYVIFWGLPLRLPVIFM